GWIAWTSRNSWFGSPPAARFSAASPSRIAEKMIDCMTSFAALGMAFASTVGGLGSARSLSRGAMRRHFHKMHGLGNDFVIVDARSEPFDVTPSLARSICDRRTGVGCDQLIVLEPSDSADLRMRIWNSDGGEVESCGNAARCVVQLTGARRIETDGGLLDGESFGAEVEVSIREPRFGWDEIPLA